MKRKKGISLIVLIITIIVVVVLATAVILSIINNNPIENAKKAKEAHDQATLEEVANLIYTTLYTNEKINNNQIDYEKMTNKVRKGLEEQGFLLEEYNKVEVTENGIKKILVIPNGFKYVTGTVDTGYVIENSSDGNQFVWVPVDNIEEFVRKDGYNYGYIQKVVSSGTAIEPYTNEKDEYDAMMESVEKYGGFYIGRYEASKKEINGKEIARSVANQEPWAMIKWGESMTSPGNEGAVGKARAVYPVENATKDKDAVSTLVFGVQWDTTVRFIEKNYPGITQDSIKKGNYRDSNFTYTDINGNEVIKSDLAVKIPTGSTEDTKTNNIYDMCGNIMEWTMEVYENDKRVRRGGNFANSGVDLPISNRIFNTPDYNSQYVGFRLALYMK